VSFIFRILKIDPMARLIDQMGKLRGEIRIREEKIKKLKVELRKHMKAAGVTEYSGEMYKVTLAPKPRKQ